MARVYLNKNYCHCEYYYDGLNYSAASHQSHILEFIINTRTQHQYSTLIIINLAMIIKSTHGPYKFNVNIFYLNKLFY